MQMLKVKLNKELIIEAMKGKTTPKDIKEKGLIQASILDDKD